MPQCPLPLCVVLGDGAEGGGLFGGVTGGHPAGLPGTGLNDGGQTDIGGGQVLRHADAGAVSGVASGQAAAAMRACICAGVIPKIVVSARPRPRIAFRASIVAGET